MKLKFLIIMFCVVNFTIYIFAKDNYQYIHGIVYKVHDGDSIKIKSRHKKYTLRLACIGAPELSEKFGLESGNYLRSKIIGKKVYAKIYEKDRYNRDVAEIFFENKNINLIQVQYGHAFVYEKYLYNCNAKKYFQVENSAKIKKIGAWAIYKTKPKIYRKKKY